MQQLHAVDWGLLIGYFAITLVVGVLMTRTASRSLEHYFLANRSLPWPLLGIAGMTSWFDMTGTMIITAFLFLLGPRGLYVEFRGGAVLILAFMLVYTGKWHRRSGCMTIAEWMRYRFGTGRGAEVLRIVTAVSAVFGNIAGLAYLVRGCSLFMGQLLPWPSQYTTIAVVSLTALYTVMAGFYGVVLTDLLQGVIIIVACVIVAVKSWALVPDAASLGATAERVTGNGGWLGSLPSWQTSLPDGFDQYEFLFIMAGFYLLRNVLFGMGTSGAENRYFGARSDRDCGMQSLLQGITVAFRWPMMMGFAVMGIFLVARLFPDTEVFGQATDLVRSAYPAVTESGWHDLTSQIAGRPEAYPASLTAGLASVLGPDWTAKLPLVSFRGTVAPEQILPAVLLTQIPVGLKGLLLVAMFAAMMSTFTTMTNGMSALVVKDLYQAFFRPAARNRELIAMSWLATAGIAAASLAMGFAADSINDIWGWIIMGLGAGGLAPNLLRLYWWRCNAWGCTVGITLGGTAAIVQRIFWREMPEWQQFVSITLLTLVATVLGSLLTAPDTLERLRHFYRTTRPFGLWRPVRETFNPAEQRVLTAEHRNDIIAVPFVLLWQITLFLLPMQLVIHNYTAFWRILPAFLLGCAGMYWFWYRELPPAKPATVSMAPLGRAPTDP